MKATISRATSLPVEQIFHLVPAIYPHLVRILDEEGITPAEFFALSYLRHFGAELQTVGGCAMPVSEFHTALLKGGVFQSPASASGFLSRMVDRRLIRRTSITDQDRREYFPTAQGWKTVVVLSEVGTEKLAAISKELKRLFSKASEGLTEEDFDQASQTLNSVMPVITESLRGLWLDN